MMSTRAKSIMLMAAAALAVMIAGAACGDLSETDQRSLDAEGRFQAGMKAFDNKDYADARTELMAALKLDPSHAEASNALEWVNQIMGEKGLIAAADPGQDQTAPDDGETTGLTDGGSEGFIVPPELITEAEPLEFWSAYADGVEAWQRGDYEAMLDAADEALAWLDPNSEMYEDVARGRLTALVLNDYYEEASWAVSDLLELDPDDPLLLNVATVSYERAGYLDNAVWAAERAYDLAPQDWNSQNNLAYTYAVSGSNLDYAYQLAQTALAGDPTNGAYLDTMAWVLFQSGNAEQALQHIQQALLVTVNHTDRQEILAHYEAIRRALN